MKLAVTSIFTKSYSYAIRSQLAQIQKNLELCQVTEAAYIFVTDEPRDDVAEFGKKLMPNVEFINVVGDFMESQNYKEDAQKTIARMMSAAFNRAIAWGAEYVWNVESDVLPMFNNLRTLKSTLDFDGGYYGVAFSPYISQGGGGLLGGYGDSRNPIFENFYEDELELPKELKERRAAHEKGAPKKGEQPLKAWLEEGRKIHEALRSCPPRMNIFAAQAKGYRPRGWGEHAMPQSGRGMIWEVDWIGTGNVLLSKAALLSSDFIGYERGGGTQDLHLCYRKWKANGLRIACTPHSPCHHVIRKPFKDDDGKEVSAYTAIVMHFEEHPSTRGHLRHTFEPFFDMQG